MWLWVCALFERQSSVKMQVWLVTQEPRMLEGSNQHVCSHVSQEIVNRFPTDRLCGDCWAGISAVTSHAGLSAISESTSTQSRNSDQPLFLSTRHQFRWFPATFLLSEVWEQTSIRQSICSGFATSATPETPTQDICHVADILMVQDLHPGTPVAATSHSSTFTTKNQTSLDRAQRSQSHTTTPEP